MATPRLIHPFDMAGLLNDSAISDIVVDKAEDTVTVLVTYRQTVETPVTTPYGKDLLDKLPEESRRVFRKLSGTEEESLHGIK